MTKPPHTGTQQPGNHPLPAVSGISSFRPAQVSFFIGLFRLLQPLLVPLSEVRQGRLWLAPDMFLSHISPQGECWLSPVQQGDEHRGRSTPWHWAEQEAPTLGHILAELGLAAGTSVPRPLCSGNTGSCRSPWKVPWQQTPIPSLFLSPTMPRGTAEGSGCLELSLFLNPPLHHL